MPDSKPPDHPRLESLDGIRLLTAFGVLLYHYNGEFGIGLEPLIPGLKRVYLLVDLFFVLSGFVIAESYQGRIDSWRSYGSYMVRRLGRIYPLHVATLVLTLVLGQAFVVFGLWDRLPHHMDPGGFLPNLLLLQGWGILPDLYFNYPSWSISAELLQYLVFPFWLMLARRLSGWAAALLFLAGVYALAGPYLGGKAWSGFTYDGALRACPSFFAGVAIAVTLRRRATLPRVPWPVVYAFGAALILVLGSGFGDAWVIALDPVLILLAVLAERGSRRTWLRSAPVVRYGQASYSIYMLHIPISVLALGLGRPLLGSGWGASVALCLLSAAAVLWLAPLSFRYVEQPAQNWIARLGGLRAPRKPGVVA